VPELSVPSFRLFQRGIGWRQGRAYGAHEINAIGAWLPELEFTHYAATPRWRELMDSCEAFVAVSGNVLAATPFLQTKRPYLAWVATDWQGDRQDRVKHFPFARRLLDVCINAPVIRRLERRLLKSGHILSLSQYTSRMLADVAGPSFQGGLLAMPVDTEMFLPDPGACIAGRLGFAGRFTDPRKNIGLFLRAVAQLLADGNNVSALLIGDIPDAATRQLIDELGIGPHVQTERSLTGEPFRDKLQELDIFVLPSHQEGLCIAALEAMACGVPVVSTRCGGPEEFVLDGTTGTLVDAEPKQMAQAIAAIVGNRKRRAQMGIAARQIVEHHYAVEKMRAAFAQGLRDTFPRLAFEGSNVRSAAGFARGPKTDWAVAR
jgi:glycosyltransferase involved in cell wall biosynthesis